jgi:hypothetical protein
MPTSEKSAHLLIETINAAGGLLRFADGTVAPACDPDWVDLGEAYLAACTETEQAPCLAEENGPSPSLTDTIYRVTRGEISTLVIASVDHLHSRRRACAISRRVPARGVWLALTRRPRLLADTGERFAKRWIGGRH